VVISSNSRSWPSTGFTRSSSRRRGRRLLDVGEQRGGEQHVVERHRPPPPLSGLLVGRQQVLGAAVGDQDSAFGVGQQDRIGDRLDDALEPLDLTAPASLGVARGRVGEGGEAHSEAPAGPGQDLLVQAPALGPGDQQQTDLAAVVARSRRERHDGVADRAERGDRRRPAVAFARRLHGDRLAALHRHHQRMGALRELDLHRLDAVPVHAEPGEPAEGPAVGVEHQAESRAGAGLLAEPLERPQGAAPRVALGEQGIGQSQTSHRVPRAPGSPGSVEVGDSHPLLPPIRCQVVTPGRPWR
jgi:hypothetical protein